DVEVITHAQHYFSAGEKRRLKWASASQRSPVTSRPSSSIVGDRLKCRFLQGHIAETPALSVENQRAPEPLHVGRPDVHGVRVQPRDAALGDPLPELRLALRAPTRTLLVL